MKYFLKVENFPEIPENISKNELTYKKHMRNIETVKKYLMRG